MFWRRPIRHLGEEIEGDQAAENEEGVVGGRICRAAVGQLDRSTEHQGVGDQRDQRRDDRPHPARDRSAEALAQLASEDRHDEIAMAPCPGERFEQEQAEPLNEIVIAREDLLAIDNVQERRIGLLPVN